MTSTALSLKAIIPKEIYPIVEALGAEGHGLKASCRLLGVSGSGFFHWRGRPLSARAVRRAWLADVVTEIWEWSRRTYGWRRIQAELAEVHDHTANKKLLRAVMRKHHISGLPRPKARRRDLTRAPTTADLVNREFSRAGPNLLWMTDITEHPTREGKLYCCAVLDAWSRKVVGWSLDRRPTAAMVNSALAMALHSRGRAQERWSTPTTALNTHHGRSADRSAPQGSSSRWAPSATHTTMPWSSPLGDACKPNSSTPENGRPASSSPPRSSTGSKCSTIANGATRPSGTSHPSNSSDAANNNPKPPDSHNRSPTSGGHITWPHNRVPLIASARPVIRARSRCPHTSRRFRSALLRLLLPEFVDGSE